MAAGEGAVPKSGGVYGKRAAIFIPDRAGTSAIEVSDLETVFHLYW